MNTNTQSFDVANTATTVKYLRELIRGDQEDQAAAAKRLRVSVSDG